MRVILCYQRTGNEAGFRKLSFSRFHVISIVFPIYYIFQYLTQKHLHRSIHHAKRHLLPPVIHFFVKISKFGLHIFMSFQRILMKFAYLLNST